MNEQKQILEDAMFDLMHVVLSKDPDLIDKLEKGMQEICKTEGIIYSLATLKAMNAGIRTLLSAGDMDKINENQRKLVMVLEYIALKKSKELKNYGKL